jgi:hypothetical protein
MNILVTLFLGLAIIKFIQHKNPIIRYFAIFIILGLTFKIGIDYGLIGILSIVCFYLFFKNPLLLVPAQTLLYTSNYLYYTLMTGPTNLLTVAREHNYFAPLALIAIPITSLYNGKKGRGLKYFFYSFYPLQFVVFYIIRKLAF